MKYLSYFFQIILDTFSQFLNIFLIYLGYFFPCFFYKLYLSYFFQLTLNIVGILIRPEPENSHKLKPEGTQNPNQSSTGTQRVFTGQFLPSNFPINAKNLNICLMDFFSFLNGTKHICMLNMSFYKCEKS